METINKQTLRNNYQLLFCLKVQNLISMRKNLRISQSRISFLTGKSLKTIQNFENYKCNDAFLLYSYKQILKDKD